MRIRHERQSSPFGVVAPSLQRDYAILGNRPQHVTPLLGNVSEDEEDDGVVDTNGSLIDASSLGGDVDNMSNLSLPEDAVAAASSSSPKARQRRPSKPASLQHVSPYLGPASFGDYARGNRMANLHQQLTTLPVQMRQNASSSATAANTGEDAAGGASVGGLFGQVPAFPSSLILGGHHMMPPPDADMRSQEELDYASQSSLHEFAPTDDDITPRPGAYASGLHMHQELPRRAPARSHSREASESRPLISVHTTNHSTYGTDANASDVHQRHGAGRARRPSLQMMSGWDMRQPAPPAPAQIEEVIHESDAHIHRRELHILTQFALPIWLCHLLELSLNVVSVFSLGHLGTNELAAASLSSMTANVTGFSILAGFISALDSILPGAYTSQPKMVGLYTQRMMVIVAGLLVPISIIWLSTEPILLALGQDPLVASLAAQYLRILVIGLPGYAGFEVCRRYLQAQNLMHAPTIVLFVASPVNAILNWLFVWGPEQFRFGFIGAPLASVISMWLMFFLGVTQCYIAPRVAWDGWTPLAFTGLLPIINLGLAGTFAMCAEWWSWEIVGLVTSKLGTIALAAQSVLLVCSSISYQLPYAISVAAAVRVGNLLGAMQPRRAHISSNMSMFLSLCAGLANSTMFLLLRSRLGHLFSEDADVIRLVTLVLPVMAAFQVMDGVCGVAAGILRGTGRQGSGAIINLTGYYVIGIPFGLLLTFGPPDMGLSGLWIGLTVALTYAAVFSFLIIKRTDWKEEVSKTMARMGMDETAVKPADTDGQSPIAA
jgi:MATE family multidrug resistance protein